MMEHVALSTTILNRSAKLGYPPGLKCTLYSSYAFDSSVWEMFGALLNGFCLYIPSNEQRLASLTEYLNQNRIDMFVSTPTVVQNLLQSPDRVPSLKLLDLGGEAMTKRVVAEWSNKVRLHNCYGHHRKYSCTPTRGSEVFSGMLPQECLDACQSIWRHQCIYQSARFQH